MGFQEARNEINWKVHFASPIQKVYAALTTATGPFAKPMNEIPKAVFTKKGFKDVKSGTASWAEARIFEGDMTEGIRDLKAGSGKPIVAIGGAGFMGSLIATGFIDEYHLAIHPVTLGSGLPIFTGLQNPLCMKLAQVKAFPAGTIAMTYLV